MRSEFHMTKRALLASFGLMLLSIHGFARNSDAADTGSNIAAQAAADAMRQFAGTDGAFLAADLVKETYSKENLASLLKFPSETMVVVSISGAQLKQAFERSLSLFPHPNPSFLQLSGFEVTFKSTGAVNQRVIRATANGSPIVDTKTYTVAMPSTLGRGILGYFKVWEQSQITKTFDQSLDTILLDKPFVASAPRWSAQ